MKFLLVFLPVCFFVESMAVAESQIVGEVYTGATNEIVSLDPQTDDQNTIASNVYPGGYYSDSFVASPADGIVYAEGSNYDLYSYSLNNGAELNSPLLPFAFEALALESSSNYLIGIDYNGTANDVRTINAVTGATSILASNVLPGGVYADTFRSNPGLNVFYAEGANQKLYSFNMSTGVQIAAPTLSTTFQSLGLDYIPNTLIGFSYSGAGEQLSSVNTLTGAITLLNPSVLPGGYHLDSLVSDPESQVLYAIAGNGQLYEYSMSSGDEIASFSIDSQVTALTGDDVPEPRSIYLFILSILWIAASHRRVALGR
jgi:hypothetical protein